MAEETEAEAFLPERDEGFAGVPYVGCPATIPVGSDSYPGTVVDTGRTTVRYQFLDRDGNTVVLNMPRTITVRDDEYRGVKDFSNAYTEAQRYQYLAFPEGPTSKWSWRPRLGRYVQVGSGGRRSQGLGLGFRRAYRDPHF